MPKTVTTQISAAAKKSVADLKATAVARKGSAAAALIGQAKLPTPAAKKAKPAVDHTAANKRIAAFVAEEAAEAARRKAAHDEAVTAKRAAAQKAAAAKLEAESKAQKAAAKKAAPSPAPAPTVRKIVVPATPALDAAATAKPPTKAAKSLDNAVTPAVVCRRRSQSYTCIRLNIGETHTHFITLADLAVKKLPNREFHNDWEEYTDYPVRRAAELYLQTPHREIESQARRHLEAIVKDPLTIYDLDAKLNQPQSKELPMATAKKTAAAPAVVPNKAGAAAKKTAPAPAAKTAAPAAKTAPAAKVPAKTAAPAAKKAAPNGIATVVTGAKPPAKQAATAAAKTPVARAPDATLFTVADATVARRGTTAEFQEGALELLKANKNKGFTRQQLIDKMVSKGHEAGPARIKVADMVYFKILAAA